MIFTILKTNGSTMSPTSVSALVLGLQLLLLVSASISCLVYYFCRAAKHDHLQKEFQSFRAPSGPLFKISEERSSFVAAGLNQEANMESSFCSVIPTKRFLIQQPPILKIAKPDTVIKVCIPGFAEA